MYRRGNGIFKIFVLYFSVCDNVDYIIFFFCFLLLVMVLFCLMRDRDNGIGECDWECSWILIVNKKINLM